MAQLIPSHMVALAPGLRHLWACPFAVEAGAGFADVMQEGQRAQARAILVGQGPPGQRIKPGSPSREIEKRRHHGRNIYAVRHQAQSRGERRVSRASLQFSPWFERR